MSFHVMPWPRRARRGRAALEDFGRDLLVELGGGGEQIVELVELEDVAARSLFLETQPLLACRVGGEQLATHGLVEDPAQQLERGVDSRVR